jgi:hypothetical protein
MSNQDVLNAIDNSDLSNEPHTDVENSDIAIPDTASSISSLTQRGKVDGVGVVVRAADVAKASAVRIDGRSQEILDTLRSLIHGFKATEKYIFDTNDYMKTVIANQDFLRQRIDSVLDLMAKEGIDFKHEVTAMRQSAETVRLATLTASPDIKAQQPGPKSDRFNAAAMTKVYDDNAAQAIAQGRVIPPAAPAPAATPTSATPEAAKKKGKPFCARGGTAFMMLEVLYRSGDTAMARNLLYQAVAAKVANPYPVLLSLSTNTPPFVTVEGRGDKTIVKITEAGIAHIVSTQVEHAQELLATSKQDPDNMAFQTAETQVCDNEAEVNAAPATDIPF